MTTARSLHKIAAELRRVADQLDAAPDTDIAATDVDIRLQVLNRKAGGTARDSERIAAVDAIAAAVGTTPETDDSGGHVHHRSATYGEDTTVLAYTAITGKPDPAGEQP